MRHGGDAVVSRSLPAAVASIVVGSSLALIGVGLAVVGLMSGGPGREAAIVMTAGILLIGLGCALVSLGGRGLYRRLR